MKTLNNSKLVELFGCVVEDDFDLPIDFVTVNAEALKHGYFVYPAACLRCVLDFLKSISTNYNSTFYKTWNDVASKSRTQLYIEQCLHYFTTYGTDFSLGNGFVPNDDLGFVPPYENFKLITVVTCEEMHDKCMKMLCSGVALKQETMQVVSDYIIGYAKKYKATINVDAIKNKEALVYICNALKVVPSDKFNLLRYIVYVTTSDTMLIKNKELIRKISYSLNPFDFSRLSEKNMCDLSSIFLRFKPIFLAFKANVNGTKNKPYINKLRRLAKVNHAPMAQGFWQTIFTEKKSVEDIIANAKTLPNYKKVALMQTCLERSNITDSHLYIVRNQKAFLRENYTPNTDVVYNATVYALLRQSLVESLMTNSTKNVEVTDENGVTTTVAVPKVVKIVEGVDVALPTSEKSFIGNYPFGTAYNMSLHNYFGIYWRNEWGTRDYDLSFVDVYGNKIGWNSSYYSSNNDVIYSGDMTNADPEATEVLYFKNSPCNGIIKVNQFSGQEVSKFRFFFGQENIDASRFSRNFMVNPNSIKLNVDVPTTKRETTVGVVTDNKLVLMALNTGNLRVSTPHNTNATKDMVNIIMNKTKYFVNSTDILKDAGFIIVDSSYTGEVDIDMSNLKKDDLINIMA